MSLRFHTSWFGFDPATARTCPDATVIVRDGDRFDLALHPSADTPRAGSFLHFGFAMPSSDAVHALHERMTAGGVTVVERDSVSFKCLEPDGWRVEVYWEPAP